MKLEKQVCTLEQAKRLEELGIKSESIFYHVPWKAVDFEGVFIGMECNKGFVHVYEEGEVETFSAPECFSAYTASELAAMIPFNCVRYWKMSDEEYRALCYDPSNAAEKIIDHKTLAGAMADALIFLIEAGVAKINHCNEQLATA